MTRPTTTSTKTTSRISHFGAAVMGLALAFSAVGCGGMPQAGDGTVEAEAVQCPAAKAWAPGIPYKVGDLAAFSGSVFQCRQAHTAQSDWSPTIVPALWADLKCTTGAGAQQPPAQQPPAQQPPVTQPPVTQPPVTQPPANNQCSADGRPGPKFDPAGAKNVGNGTGGQFIGGQCLRAADCASGCCALPCGICSGPGAQFQNGKLGCGFGG
jgi:hypothetical protein